MQTGTLANWTLVSGDGKKKYTLPKHATAGENTATGSRASTTSLTITLSGSVKTKADNILVKHGNLEAAAGFVMGNPADTKDNHIIVGNF